MVELMEKTLIPSYPDLPLELPEAANSLVYLDKGTAVLDLNGHVCLTIDDVCKHFGFNRLYITNLFRKWTGQGIREYLVDERIQAAKRLLSSTSQPVDDIAKKCGFSTSSYFARQFHLREGCSPTQYRAHCHEGKPLSLYKTDNSSGM